MGLPRLLVILAFALLARPVHAEPPTYEDVGGRVRDILGDGVVKALLRAKRAEAFALQEMRDGRIDPRPPERSDAPDTIQGYRIAGKARPLDTTLLDQFRLTLLDSDTYPFEDVPRRPNTGYGSIKLCGGFRPGVAIRFWGEVRGKPTHVDALLCFNCGDVAIVEEHEKARPAVHDMHSGELRLLRLASAALPDMDVLSDKLAREQDERARERLFVMMFPARTQVAMERERGGRLDFDRPFVDGEKRLAIEAEGLANSLPGPALFETAARAFAVRRGDWPEIDDRMAIPLLAVKRLRTQDVLAGWKRIASDQLALAGVAELEDRHVLDGNVPRATRETWLPTIAEAAIVQSPGAALCHLLDRVVALPDGKGVPLVKRTARGELEPAARPWTPYAHVSARGCALIALTKVDAPLATTEARAWSPPSPIDQAAKRAALYLAGDVGALDGSVLGIESNAVAEIVLAPLRAHPTRQGLDLVVRVLRAQPTDLGVIRVNTLLTDLAGADRLPYNDDSVEQRAGALQTWWTLHAATWSPPKPRN